VASPGKVRARNVFAIADDGQADRLAFKGGISAAAGARKSKLGRGRGVDRRFNELPFLTSLKVVEGPTS
jgi:hypothetical protein